MLTDFDKQLLNLVQHYLPVSGNPFALIALQLGVEEEQVLGRLRFLKEHGYIRRIGAFFDSERLGYLSTLVALEVEPDMIEQVAEAVNRFPGVTHNYIREDRYNMWFTLLSPDKSAQDGALTEIAAFEGVVRLLNLPSVEKYKVNVRFNL